MDTLAHRKATRVLRFSDQSGAPLKNQTIYGNMTRHAFLFGCGAFDTIQLADENAKEAQMIMDRFMEIFNFGTLPFYWGRFEPIQGQPDIPRTQKAAAWLKERHITPKGHPLCWHTHCAPWLMEKPLSQILDLQLERIDRDVSAFRGQIDMWDVINEVVIMPEFVKEDNAMTRLCQKIGRVALAKKVFDAAREANPVATLLLNDFNVSDAYRRLFDDCLKTGAAIDGVGIQSHQHQGFWGLEKLEEVVTRFEDFGLPLHFTENTFISGHLMPPQIDDLNDYRIPSWPSTPEGEQRQKEDLLTMVDFLFARKSVDAFTVWCPIDGRWLGAPAGLLRQDGTPKPAFEALKKRVTEDWWTRTQLQTDENGIAELTGFLGDYQLTSAMGKADIVFEKGEQILDIVLQI